MSKLNIDINNLTPEEESEHLAKIGSYVNECMAEAKAKIQKVLDYYGMELHVLIDLSEAGGQPRWGSKEKKPTKTKTSTKKAPAAKKKAAKKTKSK